MELELTNERGKNLSEDDVNMHMPGGKKPEPKLMNLGKMDIARCQSINGTPTESQDCLLHATVDPNDPDTMVIHRMKYQQAGSVQPQE